MTPRATYRLQLNKDFTFADAIAVIPYLDALGISHIYASPITLARAGSTHGYDVVDPTHINPELGGETGFRRLVAALRARGMGVILDIVPNHMGIGAENPWWTSVLQLGPSSPYATVFDIDWSRHGGKMLLPFLGAPLPEALASGDLTLGISPEGAVELRAYGDTAYPLAPGTAPARDRLAEYDPGHTNGRGALAGLLEHQHYRLAWWRAGHDELNWRRFFSVTELAGVRVEDEQVFEATHALFFKLYGEGLIDGLRIDHIDGLTDPGQYIKRLRDRLDAVQSERPAPLDRSRAWLIVEKILGPDEHLPPDWDVDGTSGYEFMNLVSALQHDPEGETALTRAWHEISARAGQFAPEEMLARRQMLDWEFTAQFNACLDAFWALARRSPQAARFTRGMLSRAIRTLLEVFPVYRTYGTGNTSPASDESVRDRARRRAGEIAAPGELEVVDAILDWLAGNGADDAAEAVRRFQQLSAPIAAKSVEDTAYYRYGRLLSRNDVGFDASVFSLPIATFHRANAERFTRYPQSMLATATHDHKRGEDVRARLAVLSTIAEHWNQTCHAWIDEYAWAGAPLEKSDLYMLFQTLVGTWPPSGEPPEDYAQRIWGWQEKALREAKLRSSWVAPDTEYETRLKAFIDWLLASEAAADLRSGIAGFVAEIEPAALINSLSQALLRCTLPGVPDLYQGTEYRDFSLVDPDNRRAVDFAARYVSLQSGVDVKQRLIAALLQTRRTRPELFAAGEYVPLDVVARGSSSWLSFARTVDTLALVCLVPLNVSPQAPPEVKDVKIAVPKRLQHMVDATTLGASSLTRGSAALFPRLAGHGLAAGLFPA